MKFSYYVPCFLFFAASFFWAGIYFERSISMSCIAIFSNDVSYDVRRFIDDKEKLLKLSDHLKYLEKSSSPFFFSCKSFLIDAYFDEWGSNEE